MRGKNAHNPDIREPRKILLMEVLRSVLMFVLVLMLVVLVLVLAIGDQWW